MALKQLEIVSRVPYPLAAAGGPTYELVRARAHFVLDPADAANETIADLALVESIDGRVRFSADLVVLEPVGATAAPLLYVVANRGRAESLPLSFLLPEVVNGTPIAPGDAFLAARGWRIVWCGWQCDLEEGFGLLRLDAPLATVDGAPAPGFREVRIEPEEELASAPLADTRTASPAVTAYPTIDLVDPEATLYVRPRAGGELRALPRERWSFAEVASGGLEPSATHVVLDGGFQSDQVYVVSYRPASCPVNGVGLLVARDVVSGLRYETSRHLGEGAAPVSHALAFGVSQSGRYLRQFLAQGLNVDEAGRGVFDGVLAHIAGARIGDFNLRYGQLSVNRSEGVGLHPPYPSAHREGGLLDRQRALGHLPKVMLTNSAFEYWRRDCSALHVEVDASADLPEDPDVRCYLVAGTSHVVGNLTGSSLGPLNPTSVLDPLPVLRALLLALSAWVTDGSAPPASRVPRVAAGEVATRAAALAALSVIPGLALPEESMIPVTSRSHPGEEEWQPRGLVAQDDRVVGLVAALDDDGNERAGVILPELAVPLYTHVAFNPRAEPGGGPFGLLDLVGTSLPLPTTTAERATTGDPRRAIEERYSGGADYLERIRRAASRLVEEGYLLASDEEVVVDRAARHFAELTAPR